MSKNKVYIFYLNLPDDLHGEFDKEEVDRFYEVKDFLMRLTKYYNESLDRWYYLYAFTTKKKYANRFEDVHNMKIFTKKVVKLDDEDYRDFKKENITCKLRPYSCGNYNEKTELICTKNEIISFEDDFPLIIDSEISMCTESSYEAFKKPYIKHLDMLLYCLYHKIDEDDADDFYSYQYSYGITPENSTNSKVSLLPDVLSMYIRHFGILLKK